MKAALTMLYTLLASLNPMVAAFFGVAVTLGTVFTWIHALWANLLAQLSALTMWTVAGVTFSGVGLIDTFVPLNTLLDLTTAYIALLLAASLIRTVKSFIPAIAT